jgi:glucose-6-phosphate isomerase
MLTAKKTSILREIQTQHQQIQHLSESIRQGQLRGFSGHLLTHVIVVGRGVTMHGIEFIFRALEKEEGGQQGLEEGIGDRGRNSIKSRTVKFCSSLDPSSLSKTLAGSHPEHSCIVSIINNEAEEEDLVQLTRTLKAWLQHGLQPHISKRRPDAAWGKHLFLVSSDESFLHSQQLTKRECTFLIPEYARCAAFATTSVAGLLPLSIAFGWTVVLEILNGCHDLDSHFIDTNPRHNLPVLLALVDAWNDGCLANVEDGGERGRVVVPFMQSFGAFPSFCAAVESQVCIGSRRSKYRRGAFESPRLPSAIVVDGGVGTGTYDQLLFQCGRTRPCELIVAMESQVPRQRRNEEDALNQVLFRGVESQGRGNDSMSNQDYLIGSFFSHADVLAFGSSGLYKSNRQGDARSVTNSVYSGVGYGLGSTSFDSHNPSIILDSEISNGNRPSTLLICGKCDAFTCGQLIALAEHRAIVSARLWDLDNSFAFTQSHGSSNKMKQVEVTVEKLDLLYQRLDLVGTLDVEEGEDETGAFGPKLSLASTTLLGLYATSVYDQNKL